MPPEKRIDCPALRMRSDSYPFGNRVPRTVRMLRTVTADPMPVIGLSYIKGDIPVAPVDEIFKVWTNSHGAVAAVLPNGTRLGLRPEEFEVETWHDLSAEATVGLVDFGFDDRMTKVTQEAYSIFLAREAAARGKIEALQQRLNAADQRIDEQATLLRRCEMAVREQHCDQDEADFDLPAELMADIDAQLSGGTGPEQDDDWHMNPCKKGHRDVGASGRVAACNQCDEKIEAATTQEAFERWNAMHPAAQA